MPAPGPNAATILAELVDGRAGDAACLLLGVDRSALEELLGERPPERGVGRGFVVIRGATRGDADQQRSGDGQRAQ